MKKTAALIIIALGLCGCVARHMTDGLQSLVGQNIRVAVNKLGYPDGQRTMLGDKIYVWSTSHRDLLPMSSLSTTTGYIGNVPVRGTTSNIDFEPVDFNCTIQIAVDAQDIIKTWRWAGNMGGCEPYADALTR